MRILVHGAGAVGSLLAAHLARRHDVTVVARPPHARAIAERGLVVEGHTQGTFPLRAVSELADAPRDPEWAFLTVKAYDSEASCRHLAARLDLGTRVLSLQNGLGNLEQVQRAFGDDRAFAGSLSHGIMMVEPGRIRHAGVGDLVVGSARPAGGSAARALAAAFTDAGLPARVSPDISGELWGKAIVNAGINPVAALAGVPNGSLLEDAHLRARMEAAAAEAWAVARALKIPLPPGDWVERTRDVARKTAQNRNSMTQSLAAGKRTEIEAITGVVVREGERLRVPVPVNRELLAAVRAREAALRLTK